MASIRTISAYLLKADVKTAREAFKPEDEIGALREHAVEAGETTGSLFVQAGDLKQPAWVTFLGEVTEPPIDDTTRRLNAILVLEAAGRHFAITFGSTARFLLDSERYERDFGLFCALNSVDPAQLRGAEARTLEGNVLHTLRQLSRLSSFTDLEIDTDRELVVGLAGRLVDPAIGSKVDGRDAVRLTAKVRPPDLKRKCAELLAAREATTYRDYFPFVDQIRPVRDPKTIERLEANALDELRGRRFEGFDLFPPQAVSAEIVRFEIDPIPKGLKPFVEPDSSLLHYPVPRLLSREEAKRALNRFRIRGIDEAGEAVDEWTFFKCLHWESAEEGTVYVLDGGRWHAIDKDLVNEVEQFVTGLQSSGLEWLEALKGETEGDYNEAAAVSLDCAMLDRKLVKLPGKSPIEACDLFTAQGHFVHVKHRKGGSGPLSHLYAQAIVSAECFVSIPEFRVLFKERLEEAKPGYGQYSPEVVHSADYSVVLALIATPAASRRRDAAQKLPFFSKVMLRAAVRRLEAMGFNVYLDVIPTVAERKKKAPVPAKGQRKEVKAPSRSRSARSAGAAKAGKR